MGFLDQIAGQVTNKLGGQQQESAPQNQLLNSVMGMINSAGGLPGLLQKFKDSGLQDQVASWVGTGENKPVSADQIEEALGEDTVRELAQDSGVAPANASSVLAQLLPQIVDKLTPDGQVPNDDVLQQGLSMLKGKLFG